MAWVGFNWVYDIIRGMRRNNSNPNILPRLIYRSDNYNFISDKSYLYKTQIYNLDEVTESQFLSKETQWGDTLNVTFTGGINNYTQTVGYIYLSSSPNSNTLTNNWVIYSASASFTQSGIKNVIVSELDWKMNGVSWINNGNDSSYLSTANINTIYDQYCPGWTYLESVNRFMFFGASPSSPNFYPRGGTNNDESLNYLTVNCIYRFIKYQTFNLKFNYFRYTRFESDLTKGIKVYLSDNPPPTTTSLSIWSSFISNSIELGSFTQSIGALYLGLSGAKYLVFVGEKPGTLDGVNIGDIYDIEIEGGYHPSNNRQYTTFLPDITSNIQGATFSAISGSGALIVSGTNSTLQDDLVANLVYSKIGNSLFRSGIWENGVWNNGWRKDENVREFYEVDQSLKISSDVIWRFRITGPSDSVESFKIGDEISIGNIVGIDINEKRKLLKGSYKIISKSNNGIDNRTGFIIVEIETTFPLRRIEKDSDNHRIYVTKNIWLSGAFLNGYYDGVWNYGLFKGYPLITEMFNTQWIDGIIDGGHFSTDYYIQGSFSQTFYSSGNKVGLSFSTPHNLKLGDIIEIEKDNKSINSYYDGECKIVEILDNNRVVTDIEWGVKVNNESGSYYSTYTTGVIQNMKFNSNNTSRITSVSGAPGQLPISSSVFTYNSWIDVKYQDDSAVNIGRQQTWLNEVSMRYYSENNLYGYPTNDILSSISNFRDSYSLMERDYNLGLKYSIYSDYVGDSSIFSEYFRTDIDEQLFLDRGWTYSVESTSYATFSRTIPVNSPSIQGEELKVTTNKNGVYLDIATPTSRVFNRTLEDIEKNRYTIVEFDLITYSVFNTLWYPTRFLTFEIMGNTVSLPLPDIQNAEPVINFNNINKTFRNDLGVEKKMTYLPIYNNINHLETKKRRKIEYFYNKRSLSMNFKGNGWSSSISGAYDSEFIINNLKVLEVDMIPFFKYFNYDNINIGIQTPLQGIAPYIDYSDSNFRFLDSINIGLDSIEIVAINGVLSGIAPGISIFPIELLQINDRTNDISSG
jgi:hypothetical protein